MIQKETNIFSDIDTVKSIDKKVFKQLFDMHFHALCSFGNHYVLDPFVVEDLVQNVFIKLWDNKKNFNRITTIKSYLYTSVKNQCLNHLKHQLVLQKKETALAFDLKHDHSHDNLVVQEETFNQLFQEIKNLPLSSQEVMLLALNGLKNQEIADELGISINTVKTQKKIAYSKIKNKIHPFWSVLLFGL